MFQLLMYKDIKKTNAVETLLIWILMKFTMCYHGSTHYYLDLMNASSSRLKKKALGEKR